MKAAFWQRGETIDFKNETASVIAENTVVAIKTRIGITGTRINPNEVGSLHVCGVFEMPKKAEEMVEMGDFVYFDGTEITKTESGNTKAGYVVASAKTTDKTILVKLLG